MPDFLSLTTQAVYACIYIHMYLHLRVFLQGEHCLVRVRELWIKLSQSSPDVHFATKVRCTLIELQTKFAYVCVCMCVCVL